MIKIVGTKTLNKVLKQYEEVEEKEIYFWEGSLLDNYIIVDYKEKKAFIFLERFETTQSSNYKMIITQDKQELKKYLKVYYDYLETTFILEELEQDNTITILQEVGKLNIDYIDYNIENFIQALEWYTGKNYKVYNEIGGQFIKEYQKN